MKILIDTADVQAITPYRVLGLTQGVTTNGEEAISPKGTSLQKGRFS